jgi:hypothetical protein
MAGVIHHAKDNFYNGNGHECVQGLPDPARSEALLELAQWRKWQKEKDAIAKRKADKDADDDDSNDKDEDETEVVKRLCTQTLLHELAERCTR